ncbi:CAP domain-containing protein [Streptomyces spectabilis]|uniref:CAP domain-containing protein n=1 Tax=Streptomyces spectabilis TaxID=68270 RepID=UPI001377A340|nr:CAP domain-containing protein [Streptomyces spectabilis]
MLASASPLATAAPAATAAPTTTVSAAAADAALAEKAEDFPDVDFIVCEVNKERVLNGLSPLAISDRASGVARGHAADMDKMKRLTSIGSDGRNVRDRLNDAALYSSNIAEFMFNGYNHNGYFADMATDNTPSNSFYKALMSSDIVAFGMGYENLYTDVILLGYHRRLGVRPPVCTSS